MARAVNGDLAFLHALQQRGLGARRHAVHLIHQQQMGEHWALMELESAVSQVQHIGTDNVGRHEIRSALHALEIELQKMGERLDGERLGDPGYALQ